MSFNGSHSCQYFRRSHTMINTILREEFNKDQYLQYNPLQEYIPCCFVTDVCCHMLLLHCVCFTVLCKPTDTFFVYGNGRKLQLSCQCVGLWYFSLTFCKVNDCLYCPVNLCSDCWCWDVGRGEGRGVVRGICGRSHSRNMECKCLYFYWCVKIVCCICV